MMRRAASFGVLAVTAALLVPSSAAAQDEPPALPPPTSSGGATSTPTEGATLDSVHLRNGGLYRGHVTEIVPGDHVTVIVDKGETKRVPWAEVDRVIVGAPPAVPPPTAGTTAPTPAIPTPMVGPRAHVHISSPKSVILYRRPAGSTAWAQACNSPCNQELPIGDTYRITGNGVAASKDFRLEANPGGTVDIAVDPPSTGGMVLGGFLTGIGATAGYVGMLVALVGASEGTETCFDGFSGSCEQRKRNADEVRNGGLIAMGVGTALALAGILVFISSGKTDIVQSTGRGESSGKASRPLDAFLRQPSWKGASSSVERAGAAHPATFPVLLQGSF